MILSFDLVIDHTHQRCIRGSSIKHYSVAMVTEFPLAFLSYLGCHGDVDLALRRSLRPCWSHDTLTEIHRNTIQMIHQALTWVV